MLLRIDSNYHHQFQKLVCYHCTTQQFAVRTRVELVASDRQSEMLAITPTNHYSHGIAAATTFSGFVVCTGFEPVSPGRKPGVLSR